MVGKAGPFKATPLTIVDKGRLAFALILIVALLALLAWYIGLSVSYRHAPVEDWDRIKSAFDVVIPIVAGGVATVIAFYFRK